MAVERGKGGGDVQGVEDPESILQIGHLGIHGGRFTPQALHLSQALKSRPRGVTRRSLRLGVIAVASETGLFQLAQQAVSGFWRPEFVEQHRQGFTQLEPVAGGVGEQESELCNKASILDSSSASRLFSCLSCSVSLLNCFIRSSCCILRCS